MHRRALPPALVLALYFALLLPTVTRQGILWDEQVDLDIARTYVSESDGWLAGSPDDPSQARLPMFVGALVFALLGTSDLITARVVSVLVGALTLVGVFVYGRRRFDGARALLAAGLLATSPFFLAFARNAFTESDVYLACALIWLLVSIDHLESQPTLRWTAAAGVLMGLALSSKATAIAVLPAVWFGLWQRTKAAPDALLERRPTLLAANLWVVACLLAGLSGVDATWAGVSADRLRPLHYLIVFAGWAAVLVWAARRNERIVPPLCRTGFLTGLALLTFFVIPPEHLTNPAIVDGLRARLESEMGFDGAFVLRAAAFHVQCIIFKSGPVIGVGLLLGLAAAIAQWPRRPEIRVPVLVVSGYFAGMSLLPLVQTFYMVPVLPILALLAADAFLRLLAWRRFVALGWAFVGVAFLSQDLALCYPDYNLNGYQWLGERLIAGTTSIGYRSVVHTPSDGVQQAFEWLNEHAEPGETVLAYIEASHIVDAVAADRVYRIREGLGQNLSASPEYVVFEINVMIPQDHDRWLPPRQSLYQYPIDPRLLKSNYTKVFSVERAFGIEMATIWRRNR